MRYRKIILIAAAVSSLLLLPHRAKAVIPPDFVFNIASLAFQTFSLITIIFATTFGSFISFFRKEFIWLKGHPKTFIAIVIFLLAIAATGGYLYAANARKDAYIKWLKADQRKNTIIHETTTP